MAAGRPWCRDELVFAARAVLRRTAALAAIASSAVLGCGSGGESSGSTGSSAAGGGSGPEMPDGGLLHFPVDAVGPFRVGYRAWKITYEPKAGGGGPREIGINVWYPTLDTEGTNPVYLKLFEDTDVLENAALAPPIEPAGYPVHVYSHGASGFGATSSDLMHYFASHGWVAVAPDHTGNTLGTPTSPYPLSLYVHRSTDVSAALDALDALPEGDPLAGKCRTERVILSGHSFGTFTTWASGGAAFDPSALEAKCNAGEFTEPCAPEQIDAFAKGLGDARVVAGLPMAGGSPGWIADGGFDAASKPFFLMTGSNDPVGAEAVWDATTSLDLTWIDIEGGCHQLFALGGCAEVDSAVGYAIVNTYALAFARRHVLGDESDRVARLLDGTEPVSDLVTFQRKGP